MADHPGVVLDSRDITIPGFFPYRAKFIYPPLTCVIFNPVMTSLGWSESDFKALSTKKTNNADMGDHYGVVLDSPS